MASEETNWRRHVALASLYHHGGREAGRGGVPPRHLSTLERAIENLLQAEDDADARGGSVRMMRMALAELCRQRASRRDVRADDQIENLVARFSERGSTLHLGDFTSMFDGEGVSPDRAYLRAMQSLLEAFPQPRTDEKGENQIYVRLKSYRRGEGRER